MSSLDMPTFFSALLVTAAGAVSMMVGSEPMEAKPRILARGFSPAISPNFLEPTSTAPEPSTIPLELPPVCTCCSTSISG